MPLGKQAVSNWLPNPLKRRGLLAAIQLRRFFFCAPWRGIAVRVEVLSELCDCVTGRSFCFTAILAHWRKAVGRKRVTWLTFGCSSFFFPFPTSSLSPSLVLPFSHGASYHGSCQLNFHMVQFWCVLTQKCRYSWRPPPTRFFSHPVHASSVFVFLFLPREPLEKWIFLPRTECNTFGASSNGNVSSHSMRECALLLLVLQEKKAGIQQLPQAVKLIQDTGATVSNRRCMRKRGGGEGGANWSRYSIVCKVEYNLGSL